MKRPNFSLRTLLLIALLGGPAIGMLWSPAHRMWVERRLKQQWNREILEALIQKRLKEIPGSSASQFLGMKSNEVEKILGPPLMAEGGARHMSEWYPQYGLQLNYWQEND